MFILFLVKNKNFRGKKEVLYKCSAREKAAVMIKDSGALKCDTTALNQLRIYLHTCDYSVFNVAVCISWCLFE